MGRPPGSRSINQSLGASPSSSSSCACCNDSQLRRGPWTVEEDELLLRHMNLHGESGNWRKVPKAAGLFRCGKSCRLRWLNYLRPDLKRGGFTEDEDELIIKLHSLLGNRWSLIAGRIPGRSDNEIKNYWNFHLGKKLIKNGINPRTHKPLSSSPMPTKEANVKLSSFCHSSSFSSISSSVTSSDEDMNSPWQDTKDVIRVPNDPPNQDINIRVESVDRKSIASQPKQEPGSHDPASFTNFESALQELELQSQAIFGPEQHASWWLESLRMEEAEKSSVEIW